MIDLKPEIIDWLLLTINWAGMHPYVTWGGGSAFLASLWSSFKEGKTWGDSFITALIAVMLTLGLLAMMRITGLHEEWMPLVGIMVGFVGAERIRIAVLGAWDAGRK